MDGAPGSHISYRSTPAECAVALPDVLDDETVTATSVRGVTIHTLLT